MTNSGPNGHQFNEELVNWALESYLGVVEEVPEPLSLSDDELRPFTGTYETIAVWADITAGDGALVLNVRPKPDTLRALRDAGEDEPEQQPIPFGILPGEGDRYVVTDGPAKGMKGYFVRGADGTVEAVHLGGRLATRV